MTRLNQIITMTKLYYVKTIFLSCLTLMMTSALFAQKEYPTEFMVEYEVTYKMDSLNSDNSTTDKMYLFTGSEKSVYVNKSRAENEKRLEDLRQKFGSSIQVKLGMNNSRNDDLNKAIFKNLQNSEVQVLQHFSDKDYVYTEDATTNDWEITEETKEIAGYTTQKATTSFARRNYIAWFTMEIPLQDGPYVFYGLPGLIIELYDENDHYHFMMQSIEKLEDTKIWELPKAKKMTKEKTRELQQKLAKNALLSSDYGYMMQKTSGISGSISNADGKYSYKFEDKSGNKVSKEDLKRMYKAELERSNNPLELK